MQVTEGKTRISALDFVDMNLSIIPTVNQSDLINVYVYLKFIYFFLRFNATAIWNNTDLRHHLVSGSVSKVS